MTVSSRPALLTASTPLSEVEELALFKRRCARLIAKPERLKAVIQKAGITDNRGRLTRGVMAASYSSLYEFLPEFILGFHGTKKM